MDDSYRMVGCIDFETSSYAISVPVMQKDRSNYHYIPKTDHHFIIIDFYEIEELPYKVLYFDERRQMSISQKTPVPIIDNGCVYIIDVDWTDIQIRSEFPQLENEAVKAFISLRKRLATKSSEMAHGEIEEDIRDLLSEPVRSRYWISKYSALVRSAFESGPPSVALVGMMQDARQKWIERFSNKTKLSLVTQIMDVPGLELQSSAAKKVLLTRFEGILEAKGIFVPRTELVAHEQLFPEGILPAIQMDADSQYDYWRRGGAIGKRINDQLFNLLNPSDPSRNRSYLPARWSLQELERFLRLFNVLGGDDHLIEQAAGFFRPLYEVLLADLRACTANRYEWTSALSGRVNLRFLTTLSEASISTPYERAPDAEEWIKIIGGVLESFRKLIILAKIVRPPLRRRPANEVAFEGLDHALLDALGRIFATKNIAEINSLLRVHGL